MANPCHRPLLAHKAAIRHYHEFEDGIVIRRASSPAYRINQPIIAAARIVSGAKARAIKGDATGGEGAPPVATLPPPVSSTPTTPIWKIRGRASAIALALLVVFVTLGVGMTGIAHAKITSSNILISHYILTKDETNFIHHVNSGADIDAQDSLGNTPLHYAAYMSNQIGWALDKMIRLGADPTILNHKGKSAREMSSVSRTRSSLYLYARDYQGCSNITEAFMAPTAKQPALVERCLKLGKVGGVSSRSGYEGEGALHLVAREPWRVKYISRLVSAGADLNARDAVGRTPLMRAVMSSNKRVASSLALLGANPRLRDNNGMTAMTHAMSLVPPYPSLEAIVSRAIASWKPPAPKETEATASVSQPNPPAAPALPSAPMHEGLLHPINVGGASGASPCDGVGVEHSVWQKMVAISNTNWKSIPMDGTVNFRGLYCKNGMTHGTATLLHTLIHQSPTDVVDRIKAITKSSLGDKAADIDAKVPDGYITGYTATPLHLALYKSKGKAIIRALLDAGAKQDIIHDVKYVIHHSSGAYDNRLSSITTMQTMQLRMGQTIPSLQIQDGWEPRFASNSFYAGDDPTASAVFAILNPPKPKPKPIATITHRIGYAGSTHSFSVKLSEAPSSTDTVSFGLSGKKKGWDGSVASVKSIIAVQFTPSSLTFTSSNFDKAQTVSVKYPSDMTELYVDSSIGVSVDGAGYDGASVNLPVILSGLPACITVDGTGYSGRCQDKVDASSGLDFQLSSDEYKDVYGYHVISFGNPKTLVDYGMFAGTMLNTDGKSVKWDGVHYRSIEFKCAGDGGCGSQGIAAVCVAEDDEGGFEAGFWDGSVGEDHNIEDAYTPIKSSVSLREIGSGYKNSNALNCMFFNDEPFKARLVSTRTARNGP